MVEKNRPVLLLAVPHPHHARSLVIVAPLTSQIRGMGGEVFLGKLKWLPKASPVNIQGLSSFDPGKLSHRMGTLALAQLTLEKRQLGSCWAFEFMKERINELKAQ